MGKGREAEFKNLREIFHGIHWSANRYLVVRSPQGEFGEPFWNLQLRSLKSLLNLIHPAPERPRCIGREFIQMKLTAPADKKCD